MIYDLSEDALGERSKTYAPLICALFMFLITCNWIGLFPHLHEPTKDLNTPLSLGIMGFFIAHYAGIKAKGIGTYLKEYCHPIFLMAPLNVIGELAKVVSISFRLFGNIMGGSIIILVVSYLTTVSQFLFRDFHRCNSGLCLYNANPCLYFGAGKLTDGI